MHKNKFKQGQKVMVEGLMVNGSRLDIDGTFDRYVLNQALKTWSAECVVNSTRIILHEDQIEDWEEYWAKKKAKEKENEPPKSSD